MGSSGAVLAWAIRCSEARAKSSAASKLVCWSKGVLGAGKYPAAAKWAKPLLIQASRWVEPSAPWSAKADPTEQTAKIAAQRRMKGRFTSSRIL
jgi:hypothetical protein